MKDLPILFSGAMVRVIVDGNKMQTRRLCKPMNAWVNQDCREVRMVDGRAQHFLKGAQLLLEIIYSPYGQLGDRLLVREAWRTVASADDIAPRNLMNVGPYTHYEADAQNLPGMGKLRPSMFMPRAPAASRRPACRQWRKPAMPPVVENTLPSAHALPSTIEMGS